MGKILMGPQMLFRTVPVILVGAIVDDKPNFMAVAAAGFASREPPSISVAIRPNHYTYKGISQNSAFSINVPSIELIKETNYCGTVSGADVDKVEACKFSIFYGKSNSAPLIDQYPINMECKVEHLLELGSHVLVIGRIEETHVSESCMTDGKLDFDKIRPFTYTIGPNHEYRVMGEIIGTPAVRRNPR
jgi:flavin reductase (DIM6/NTAB) family NADH-FMN oxidoreductase RutF